MWISSSSSVTTRPGTSRREAVEQVNVHTARDDSTVRSYLSSPRAGEQETRSTHSSSPLDERFVEQVQRRCIERDDSSGPV